jgi:hypothetical protein
MRFAYQFDRSLPAGANPALGSDTAPTVAADLAGTNVFKTTVNTNGTTQRIAIGYQYTGAGPAPSLAVKGYIYDGTSETWFTVDSLGVTLTAGDIAFLPVAQLIDTPQVDGGDPYNSRTDTIEFALVVTLAGGEPNGDYTFLMGSDVSDMPDEAGAAVSVSVAAVDGTPEDKSGTRASNGTETEYLELGPDTRWSLQFVPTNPDGSTSTLTLWQSNDDTGDPTTAQYTPITNTFFGYAGYTEEAWIEPELPTTAVYLRMDVTVSGYTGAPSDPTWKLLANKRGA